MKRHTAPGGHCTYAQLVVSLLTLQRHLQNMVFYHKGLRVRKTPLPFVAYARKAGDSTYAKFHHAPKVTFVGLTLRNKPRMKRA